MQRRLIDRMADTTAFSILLALSGLLVLPVLALGVLFSPLFLAMLFLDGDTPGLVLLVLSIGGAIGIVGWLRARSGARTPERHNVGLTLAFLAIGIATALAVGAFVAYFAARALARPWAVTGLLPYVVTAFAAAHGVWVFAGIASIERLMFSYAVQAGRAFDTIPVAMLLVAAGLLLAALLALTTLG